jgi:hypothetical protein
MTSKKLQRLTPKASTPGTPELEIYCFQVIESNDVITVCIYPFPYTAPTIRVRLEIENTVRQFSLGWRETVSINRDMGCVTEVLLEHKPLHRPLGLTPIRTGSGYIQPPSARGYLLQCHCCYILGYRYILWTLPSSMLETVGDLPADAHRTTPRTSIRGEGQWSRRQLRA